MFFGEEPLNNNYNIRNIYLNCYKEKEYHSFDDIPYGNHNNSNIPILNGLNCGAKSTIYSIANFYVTLIIIILEKIIYCG